MSKARTETDPAGTEAEQPIGSDVFSSVEEAIEDIRHGKMIVVCDGEDRENEGDLVLAAQFAAPEQINFMAKHARGLICLALTPERCDELELPLMAAKNEAPLETAFTVSVEAAEEARRPRPARSRVPAQGEARGDA
jgi:3,4-dihydroxy-2-butanone 4-phosphate synthase